MHTQKHLPGLDGLRAYAALSVAVYHLSNTRGLELFFLGGGDAVTLFFVLSGFLITFLLIQERERNGSILLRHFYGRRALRILPLYYTVLVVAIVIPYIFVSPLFRKLSLDMIVGYGLMLGPVVYSIYGFINVTGALWSISVEEWFYSVWGFVAQRRWIVQACLLTIVLRIVLDPLFSASGSSVIVGVWGASRFEAMATGALGAWALVYRPNLVRILRRPLVFAWMIGCALMLIVRDSPGSTLVSEAVSVVWLVIIINVIRRPGLLDGSALRWVGERSYGIYMWHSLVITFIAYLNINSFATPFLMLGGTLLIAGLSFRFLEKPFLRLKARFPSDLVLEA